MFEQKVSWVRGTCSFKNFRASGTSMGIQNGTHGTINQTLTVTRT